MLKDEIVERWKCNEHFILFSFLITSSIARPCYEFMLLLHENENVRSTEA